MENRDNSYGFLNLLRSDLKRHGEPSFGLFLKRYLIPRGGTLPYVFWLRVVQCARRRWWTKWTVGFLAYPILRHYEFKYGIHANPNIVIGGGLLVVHGGGVFLNCASIGRNLTVYQGVTCGALNGALPKIGNDVIIYPNSVVVGGINIQDGARVGALSYVSHDVPQETTVVGAPAKAIVSLKRREEE